MLLAEANNPATVSTTSFELIRTSNAERNRPVNALKYTED